MRREGARPLLRLRWIGTLVWRVDLARHARVSTKDATVSILARCWFSLTCTCTRWIVVRAISTMSFSTIVHRGYPKSEPPPSNRLRPLQWLSPTASWRWLRIVSIERYCAAALAADADWKQVLTRVVDSNTRTDISDATVTISATCWLSLSCTCTRSIVVRAINTMSMSNRMRGR